jgi:glycine hydroxymethyltransferase
MHVIAAKAVAFGEALKPGFREYQEHIVENAKVMAESLTERGFRIVSGGTDNHVMLVDVRTKGLTGKAAEHILDEVGITVNKNTIPFDPASPNVTSGIRIGTPAVTSRGMNTQAMRRIAEAIDLALTNQDETGYARAREIIASLCEEFPLYSNLD